MRATKLAGVRERTVKKLSIFRKAEMKKITDKQRLDWLAKNKMGVTYDVSCQAWCADWDGAKFAKSPRQAIDSVIREERKP